jgi:hypothetical protein
MKQLFSRTVRSLTLAALTFTAACDADPVEPRIVERLAITVNSTVNSLSLVPQDGDAAVVRTVGLGAQGSPVGVSARGDRAIVPLGIYPFAAVVDLRSGTLVHTVALPDGSGATGSAFLNDSIALVANPGRNSVSPVNVARGTAGPEIAVGVYPHAIVSDGARIYVINANLVSWAPAGPGSVTVLDASLALVGTIQLSGINPAGAEIRAGRLYVLHSGEWGADNGSLSVVDLQAGAEIHHHTGFGDYPSSLAIASSGRIHVGLYGIGIVVWNPTTAAFERGLGDALQPGGSGTVSGIGFDGAGRLHTVDPGSCMAPGPGAMHRLAADGRVERSVPTGTCSFGIAFAEITEEG